MKLLIVTQAVDLDDSILGFFHRWIEELASRCESVLVICLREGRHQVPQNVRVLSLGKDVGASRMSYVWRFYHYLFAYRHEYDAVFVHMNQEYVLLGGMFWRQWKKRVYLWRNHWSGNFLTRIAVTLSDTVFCTSKSSFTAQFKKTKIMPVGIGDETSHAIRLANSILYLGRFAPSKHPEVLVDALHILKERTITFSASFYGSPLAKDEAFENAVKSRAQDVQNVSFHRSVPHPETHAIYGAQEVFVNLSASGMYDKTLFEAAAAGCLIIASSRDFAETAGEQFVFKQNNPQDLARILEELLTMTAEEKAATRTHFQELARAHSLPALADRLISEMS